MDDISVHIDLFPNGRKPVENLSVPPSIPSQVPGACVHLREEDSHCEQCRQQIRNMSISMLQHLSDDAISRHSTNFSPVVVELSRQRRRASHCPSASDPSMHLFSSSLWKPTTPRPSHQSRYGLHRSPAAASQLRGPPETPASIASQLKPLSNAPTCSPLH